jgi:serralysin
VQVLSGRTGATLASFFAYDPGAIVGMRVAVVDLDGDGRAEILTVPGEGAAPHVKAFRWTPGGAVVEVLSFFAFDPTFRGGAYIAGIP